MGKRSPEEKKLDKQLLKAAAAGDVAQMEKLLAEGADINTHTSGILAIKHTPLHKAVWADNAQAVAFLLKKGANTEATSELYNTPLLDAVERKSAKIVKLLLENGADATARNYDGRTPLALARYKRVYEVVDVLIEHEQQKRRKAIQASQRARLLKEAAAAAAKKEAEAENPDMVTVFRTVGDRVLQEIFNFEGRERITFVRKDKDAPVEAVTRQNFSDMDDKESIRRAFEIYARKGGTLQEKDIFEEALDKPKIKSVKTVAPAAKGRP